MSASTRSYGLVTTIALVLAAAACGGSDENAATTTAPSNANVSVLITAPADGSAHRADRVTVRGTVTPPDAAVQILGQPAQVGNGVFTGSVPLQRGPNTIDVVASAAGTAPASKTITVTRTTSRTARRAAARTATGGVPFASATNCGDVLTAVENLLCVRRERQNELRAVGSRVLEVYSPTTGQTYRMHCMSGAARRLHGRERSLGLLRRPRVARSLRHERRRAGLVVGPNTTCGFAENVERRPVQALGWINVYSPATGRTYDMFCTGSSPHVCTGGNNAAVYFP